MERIPGIAARTGAGVPRTTARYTATTHDAATHDGTAHDGTAHDGTASAEPAEP